MKDAQDFSDDEGEFEFDSENEYEINDNGEIIHETGNDNDKETSGEEQEEGVSKGTDQRKAQRLEQKATTMARKMQKPNFEIILQAKILWEQLRQKRLKKAERLELMDQMMLIVRGKALEIIYKHDASRIIQCCVKYGSMEQRDEIAEELSGHYAKLSQSKYGRFIISKILQLCSPKYRNAVIINFHGKVRRLVRHKEASIVLDEAYSQYANSAQRNGLMEEFYGPEFAIFKSTDGGPKSLQDLITRNPIKKQYVLKHTREAIDAVLEKSSFNVGKTPILHRAIIDYLSVAEVSVCKDMIELLKDHLVHMLHTRDGARVAQYCILHATPKDRKHIVKSFKGFVQSMAKEQYGYTVLLTCFECVDDTVLVGKALIGELFKPQTTDSPMQEVLRDAYASRVLLFLLCGRNRRYQPSFVVNELEVTDIIRKETSKKESSVKHEELLEIVSPLLIEQVQLYSDELIRDRHGSQVLLETCNHAKGNLQSVLDAVLESIRMGASGELTAPEDNGEIVNVVKKMKSERDSLKMKNQGINMEESVLMGRSSSLVIKLLLVKPKEGSKEWKESFGNKTWELIKSNFESLVEYCVARPFCSSGLTFVLIALFENASESVKMDMKNIIGTKKVAKLEVELKKAMDAAPNPQSRNKKRKKTESSGQATSTCSASILLKCFC